MATIKGKDITVFASTLALAAALTCGVANGSPGEIPGASLGDSVSAGAGSNVQKGQLFADDSRIDPETYDKCHRGYDAWPALIDANPKYSMERVACGASTLPDLYTGKFNEGSQFRALNPDLRFVTITDGANDIGFGPIVICMLNPFEPCTEASEAIKQARQKLKTLQAEYTQALFDIHNAAPYAAIIVVGYYELFPGGKAPGGDCLGQIHDHPEAAIGSDLQGLLRNAQIGSVNALRAMGVNAHFVNPGIGQDTNACSDNPEGLVIGARTANPQRDGYHPSAGGHRNLAAEVIATIDYALSLAN